MDLGAKGCQEPVRQYLKIKAVFLTDKNNNCAGLKRKRKSMMDRAKCLWCGNMGTRSGSNFCSKKCEVEWEQWKNKGNNYSGSSNSSRIDTSPDLIEGAFTVIGAGLSLLAGSDKPAKLSAADKDKQREARLDASEDYYLRRKEELKKNPLYQAALEKERIQDSWGLEEWYKGIDNIFYRYAKEITDPISRAIYYKSDTKIMNKFEKYRDKQKEKIRLYLEIKNNEKSSRNKKRNAKYQLRKALIDYDLIAIDLRTEARNQSSTPGPKTLVVGSFLIPIVCIILGIILRKPIIPILSFITGWFMFAIWNSKWKHGKILFYEMSTLILGGFYLATIGIIAGVALHSFLIGLFGVIGAIVLWSIAGYRKNRFISSIT